MPVISEDDLTQASILNGDFYRLPHSDVPLALAIRRSDNNPSLELRGLRCLVMFPGLTSQHIPFPQDVLKDYVLLKVTDPQTEPLHYGFCTALYNADDAASWESDVNWHLVDIVLKAIQDLCHHGCEKKPRAIAISAGGHKLMAVLARMRINEITPSMSLSFQFSMVVFIGAASHPESFALGKDVILSHAILVIVHHHCHDALSAWNGVSEYWMNTAAEASGAVHINTLSEQLHHIFGAALHHYAPFLLRQKAFWTCLDDASQHTPQTFRTFATDNHLGAAHLNDDNDPPLVQLGATQVIWTWEWYVCTAASYAQLVPGCFEVEFLPGRCIEYASQFAACLIAAAASPVSSKAKHRR